MATLKSITENIAFVFKQQFNDTLKASIEDSVVEYRSILLKRETDLSNGAMQHLMDNFCVEMELVDTSECPGLPTGKKVLRSVQDIPKAIRARGYGRSSFRYVGTVNRVFPYTYATPDEIPFVAELPFQNRNTYYGLLNNKLYVFNEKHPCKVFIEGIIDDPRLIQNCDKPNILYNDIEFKCPNDMLVGIKNSIKKEYFPNLIEDGNEVNIE
jgi:hypothetical protein